MNKLILYFFLIITFIYSINSYEVKAQSNGRGTEFWCSFPNNRNDIFVLRYIRLYFTSGNNSGDVRIYKGDSLIGLVKAKPFEVTTFDVPIDIAQVTPISSLKNDLVFKNKALFIKSDYPITVYGMNRSLQSSDGMLILPLESLGDEYIFPSYSSSQMMIIATADNSDINITIPSNTKSLNHTRNFSVNMNKGDVFICVGNDLVTNSDLSGTKITSDKIIALVSGSQCIKIPDDTYTACNHIVEMIIPTTSWGKIYYSVPLKTRTSSDTYRIYSGDTNSKVFINEVLWRTLPTYGGENFKGWFQYNSNSNSNDLTTFVSNKQIFVQQFSNSWTYDSVLNSDPFMLNLIPTEQFIKKGKVLFSLDDTSFSQNYLNVVIDSSEFDKLEIGKINSPLVKVIADTNNGFKPFPVKYNGKTYLGGTINLSNGSYQLVSTCPFAAYLYGFQAYDGFGYALSSETEYQRGGDTLFVDTTIYCQSASIIIKTLNKNPIGLRSIYLENPKNLRLNFINPPNPQSLFKSTYAEVEVAVIDTSADAEGTLVITDISGKKWRYYFHFQQTNLKLESDSIRHLPNDSYYYFTLTNLSDKTIFVQSLKFSFGDNVNLLSLSQSIPVFLKRNEKVNIIARQISINDSVSDTILIELNCRIKKFPFFFKGKAAKPDPYLTHIDWGDKWISNEVKCTKNIIKQYDTTIYIVNNGERAFNISKVFLEGLDYEMGVFKIDTTKLLNSTDTIFGISSKYNFLPVHLIFKPISEKEYYCNLVLVLKNGDTIKTQILGEGTESHLIVDKTNIGVLIFKGPKLTEINQDVLLIARKTRNTTITGIKIIGKDSLDFTFKSGFILPDSLNKWVIMPNEIRKIPITFKPLSTGKKSAKLELISDNSFCDDSIPSLTGLAYKDGYLYKFNNNIDFVNAFLCSITLQKIVIRNYVDVPLKVNNFRIVDKDNTITILDSSKKILNYNDSIVISIALKPIQEGDYNAKILFDILDATSDILIESATTNISGKVNKYSLASGLSQYYHGNLNQVLSVPYLLKNDISELKINKFRLNLGYEKTVLNLINYSKIDIASSMIKGTLLDGWDFNIIQYTPGNLSIEFYSLNKYLNGTGELFNMKFILFVGETEKGFLKCNLDFNSFNDCIINQPESSIVSIDSVCGLKSRLIDLSNVNFSLKQTEPNPSDNSFKIKFSLGFTNPTSMILFNKNGELISELINENLKKGDYILEIDASKLPSGVYYYKLRSGSWSQTKSLIISH
ncbi:MAG: IgGFc-binding protein [Chlorobiota bacterium]|nr:MAG: IgGFc-binding protein [Chlorobiota bacterium]